MNLSKNIQIIINFEKKIKIIYIIYTMNLEEQYFDIIPISEIKPIVIMTEEYFNNLINYIDASSLLFLFTITCFSSLICCTVRDKYSYKSIKYDDNTCPQISV